MSTAPQSMPATVEDLLEQAKDLPFTERQRLRALLDDRRLVFGDWDFTEIGRASFRGRSFPIEGQARKLLLRLARSRFGVHDDDIRDALDNDTLRESSIRGHASKLAAILRPHLPGAKVVRVGGGYMLDLSRCCSDGNSETSARICSNGSVALGEEVLR